MAEGRDKQSMGVVTSLTVNPATPYQLNYRGESLGIVRGTGADWFGPLNPLEPTAPPEVKGRSFDIPSGYNLNIRPRAYESITFDQLRAFADGYDLLRTVIETRKDQLARLSWNIVARGADKKRAKDPKIMDQIAKVEKFFVRPDGEHFWDDWLRMVIEDLLVLDAPAIFRRRTFGGNLYALEPIDGGTIKRVIDDWGRTPSAPAPAYQQVLKGFPAVDYTVNDLIYRPRNIRTHKVYGYSPVEQIVMTINIAIRRQVWQLQSFTEGNIPEALIGTPSTWTPDQIRAFQDWFDSLLEGNTGERRRARFVPGEVSKGYVATKPSELFGAAEEWLARIVCFAFNISAQPFVAMMNRATAETAQETAVMDGLAPLQQWVKNLVDTVILDDFGYDEVEFQWLDEDELDPNVKSTILDREVASGMLTMNEARAEKGLDPYDHEDADRPMFKSAQGYVPIYNTPEEEAEAEARVATADAQAAGGEAPPVNAEDVEGTDIAPDADKDSGDGSPVKPQEVAEKSDRPFVESGSSDGCCPDHLHKASKPAPPGVKFVDLERKKVATAEKKLGARLRRFLAETGKEVAAQVRAKLKEMGKADDEFDIDAFLSSLDLSMFEGLDDEFREYLEDVAEDSGKVALSIMGSRANDLVEQVNERSVKWAREHAADLAGINEDSPYALDRTTRDMLRATITSGIEGNLSAEEIGDQIEETYAFSEERADLIAMTEVAAANSYGALAGYEEAESMGITVRKSWLMLEDACDICQENADAGVIDLDEEFPSGDLAPPGHPNCRCVLVPEVEDEEGNVTESESEEPEEE